MTKTTFQGITFYAHPRDGHFFGKWKGQTTGLHRVVWESINGPIPPGHVIHHRDDNPANNHPDNLQCLNEADHKSIAHRDRPKQREHWERKPTRPATCTVCGTVYQTKGTRETFYCSTACHRAKHQPRTNSANSLTQQATFAKRPLKDYTCEVCNQPFQSKAIRPPKYCCGKCASRAQWLKRRTS